ncbi:MAG: PrgI family protein [bacterium]|nr:PrgI family protein [bacterium]
MQSHPVPQNITGFEFKLVGFLTIRQFGYLAAAGILCFVIYLIPLYIIVRFLLIFLIGPLGLALAFLPINDIPFDRWLVAFVRSVYTPTQRVWRKEPVELGFLAPEFSIYLQHQQGPKPIAHSDRAKLNQYLVSHHHLGAKSALDVEEEKRLGQLSQQVAQMTSEIKSSPPGQVLPPLGADDLEASK